MTAPPFILSPVSLTEFPGAYPVSFDPFLLPLPFHHSLLPSCPRCDGPGVLFPHYFLSAPQFQSLFPLMWSESDACSSSTLFVFCSFYCTASLALYTRPVYRNFASSSPSPTSTPTPIHLRCQCQYRHATDASTPPTHLPIHAPDNELLMATHPSRFARHRHWMKYSTRTRTHRGYSCALTRTFRRRICWCWWACCDTL